VSNGAGRRGSCREDQLAELPRRAITEASEKLDCTEAEAGGLCKRAVWF